MPRKHHKRKRSSCNDDDYHRVSKIASAIAKGEKSKAHELLSKCVAETCGGESNPLKTRLKEKAHRQIAAGATLLHVAARTGDTTAIELIMAHGAAECVNFADEQKRTPLHVAGANATRMLLSAATKYGVEIDMSACDWSGCSVDNAVLMAMREEDSDEDGNHPEEEEEEEKVRRARAIYGGEEDDYEGGSASRGQQTAEQVWQARLREESYFESAEAGVSGFGASWGDGGDGGEEERHGAEDVDGEDWFTVIAAQMAARCAQRAKEAREKAEAAAAAAWGARTAERRGWQHAAAPGQGADGKKSAAAAEHQRRADEAFRRLQQQQQQARELATRTEARARYIAAWVRLLPADGTSAAASSTLRVADFPWPTRSAPTHLQFSPPLTADEVAVHVLSDDMADGHARRRALQSELRRWHPDKFESRFGGRVVTSEREAILLLVKAVSQCLNELMATRTA